MGPLLPWGGLRSRATTKLLRRITSKAAQNEANESLHEDASTQGLGAQQLAGATRDKTRKSNRQPNKDLTACVMSLRLNYLYS